MTDQQNSISFQGNSARIYNLLAISLFVIIFYVGNYHVEMGALARHWWADMAWTIASLATGARCLATAHKLEGHYRKAWTFIAYACLAWFAGMLVWDYQELILHKIIPFPGYSDIGFILFAPLLMTGLLYYRSDTPSIPLTIKQISELGIILCAIIITLVIILFGPISKLDENGLYLATALAYPVLYMGLLFFGLMHPLIKPVRHERPIVFLLLAGIGIHAFTDTIYAYSLLGKSYDVGNFIDVLWVTGFGFIYWAAFEQARVIVKKGSVEKIFHDYDNDYEALIPAIVIAWISLIVIFFGENITHKMTAYILPFVISMTVFMALLGWSHHRVQKKLYRDLMLSKKELDDAYHVLDRRVIERTWELELAKEEAEDASRAKSDFLSRMSHELRTPLNGVLGFAQLLDCDKENPLTPMQQESVVDILEAGRHLLALINEVLDLSRIESGKFELNLQSLPVDTVIEECTRLLKPIADNNNITLVYTFENQDAIIIADGLRLKQVLINLLSNAIKFNNSHGTVSISTETSGDGKIRISISDTGPGIAEEHHKELFNPFTRFDQSNAEGTGVGLAVAKQLTEAMQGNIGFKSKPGQGSTFWVEFNSAPG